MLITQQNIKFCLNSFCNSSFIFTINKTLTKDFSNKNTKYYMCYYIRLKKCSLNAFKRCIILYEIFLNFYLSILRFVVIIQFLILIWEDFIPNQTILARMHCILLEGIQTFFATYLYSSLHSLLSLTDVPIALFCNKW